MSTEALVVHCAGQRCRLRLPHMRGDSAFFDRLRHDLAEHTKGANVTVNSTTGSVLLRGERLSIAEIRAFGKERGWFDLIERKPQTDDPPPTGASGDSVNSRSVRYALTGLFMLLAAVQVMRGQILVPATSFLWYALAANALPTDGE